VRAAIGALVEVSDEEEALLCGDLLGRSLADAVRLPRVGTANPRPDVLLAAIRTLIKRRLAEIDLTPSRAAATLGCSLSTLHLHCQKGGQSFVAMLQDARLDAAATLLRSMPLSYGRIEQVAFACGFADPSHFRRRFKARFGMAPSFYQDGAR
jgi:AraC-like DNA-binding protein